MFNNRQVFFYLCMLVSFGQLLLLNNVQAQQFSYIHEPPQFELAEPMAPNADTIPPGAFITPLNVGDVAQQPGVFYSLEANAWLLSEFERMQQYWILEMNNRHSLTMTWANYELQSQRNQHRTETELLEVRIVSQRRQIVSLTELNEEMSTQIGWSRREKVRFVMVVIGTAVVTGVGGYFVGQALSHN